jgi:predicted nucleotidyltransferase
MRNSSVLTALFPQVRQGVLAATLGQPDKWWYLSELADRLGTSPSSLQRELSSLVASGILVHRREGTRAYFRAQTQSPVFRDLQQLFEKTAGLVPILEKILKPFGDIQCAFIFGSMARNRERAMSDVDVMVIGKAGLADLSPALRGAAPRKRGQRHHLLTRGVPEKNQIARPFPHHCLAGTETVCERRSK